MNETYTIELQDHDEIIEAADLPPDILETLTGLMIPGRDCEPEARAAMQSVEVKATGNYRLADYLDGYGVWSEAELANDTDNQMRLLWIIGCDLAEHGEAYLSAA